MKHLVASAGPLRARVGGTQRASDLAIAAEPMRCSADRLRRFVALAQVTAGESGRARSPGHIES